MSGGREATWGNKISFSARLSAERKSLVENPASDQNRGLVSAPRTQPAATRGHRYHVAHPAPFFPRSASLTRLSILAPDRAGQPASAGKSRGSHPVQAVLLEFCRVTPYGQQLKRSTSCPPLPCPRLTPPRTHSVLQLTDADQLRGGGFSGPVKASINHFLIFITFAILCLKNILWSILIFKRQKMEERERHELTALAFGGIKIFEKCYSISPNLPIKMKNVLQPNLTNKHFKTQMYICFYFYPGSNYIFKQ